MHTQADHKGAAIFVIVSRFLRIREISRDFAFSDRSANIKDIDIDKHIIICLIHMIKCYEKFIYHGD